ncbi:hypothetical protein [Entomobacter blattae]|uniref:Uncharacterized protein n=1 Tax=Entomobacter blattae TaxID=2762277 RepID=A0A7H1NUI6_9PROT|nr:hypothetical protein [Entomobacter blattae]QNT79446.1 hypothetical protein JGUZn3_22450 [Entomobacter blattae]
MIVFSMKISSFYRKSLVMFLLLQAVYILLPSQSHAEASRKASPSVRHETPHCQFPSIANDIFAKKIPNYDMNRLVENTSKPEVKRLYWCARKLIQPYWNYPATARVDTIKQEITTFPLKKYWEADYHYLREAYPPWPTNTAQINITGKYAMMSWCQYHNCYGSSLYIDQKGNVVASTITGNIMIPKNNFDSFTLYYNLFAFLNPDHVTDELKQFIKEADHVKYTPFYEKFVVSGEKLDKDFFITPTSNY